MRTKGIRQILLTLLTCGWAVWMPAAGVAQDAPPGFASSRPPSGTSKAPLSPTASPLADSRPQDGAGMASEASGKPASGKSARVARSFLSLVGQAGPMLFPILVCSVVLLMFVFERAFSLRKRRVIPRHFVNLFLDELNDGRLKPEEALELCEENHSPVAEVFAAAVKKWNRPAVEVEQAVLDAGERVAVGLRRYLRLFNGIATLSPLLGLLGTVLGMIRAFNAIAASDALGRPVLLAEGISQALLTTAGGLTVAIPAFIAYMYFTSRGDRLIIEIDGLGQELVQAFACDVWKAKPKEKGKVIRKAA